MVCPSGHFSDLLPVFSQGSEYQAARSSISPTQAWLPLMQWPGPQKVSPGLEFLSQLYCLTLDKMLDFSGPQLAPRKTKRLAEVLSKVSAISVPPLLSVWREALPLSCHGNPGWRGRLGEVMVYIHGHGRDSGP